ncbi:MAG: DUF192 domain-containing protein [Verrucomicrobiota bacterium]
MFFRRRLPLLALAGFALLAACGDEDAKKTATKTIADRFAIKVGARTVQAQVALLPLETQRGLMHRRSLGNDEGMLFVFDRTQPMSFWMRNTEIPLDIGYFDAGGVLREIYPMYPRDERPVASRGRMQFALEMNQGWYRAAGVKPGDRLDLAAVAAAIRARGLKPADFGLR